MIRRLGILVVATLALWVATVYPAYRLGGPDLAVQGTVAMLLCLIPAAATLAWGLRAQTRPPEAQLAAMLGGTGVRMAVVLGAGYLLYTWVPELHALEFWAWLVVYYLATLALEVRLLLAGTGARAAKPPESTVT